MELSVVVIFLEFVMTDHAKGAKMTSEEAAATAKEVLDIPSQFHTTALALVESLQKKFPSCEVLPSKKLMLQGIGGKEAGMVRTMMVQEWYKHTRPHVKGIEKKDHAIFKKLKDAPFVGEIRLDKKWKDSTLSMESRAHIWMYIQNLTSMSEIQCGDAKVPPELEAVERLRKKVGIELDMETGKGNFDLDQITQFLQSAIADPTGDNARDLLTVGKTYGVASGGLASLQNLMAKQMQQNVPQGGAAAAPTQATHKKKKHTKV